MPILQSSAPINSSPSGRLLNVSGMDLVLGLSYTTKISCTMANFTTLLSNLSCYFHTELILQTLFTINFHYGAYCYFNSFWNFYHVVFDNIFSIWATRRKCGFWIPISTYLGYINMCYLALLLCIRHVVIYKMLNTVAESYWCLKSGKKSLTF